MAMRWGWMCVGAGGRFRLCARAPVLAPQQLDGLDGGARREEAGRRRLAEEQPALLHHHEGEGHEHPQGGAQKHLRGGVGWRHLHHLEGAHAAAEAREELHGQLGQPVAEDDDEVERRRQHLAVVLVLEEELDLLVQRELLGVVLDGLIGRRHLRDEEVDEDDGHEEGVQPQQRRHEDVPREQRVVRRARRPKVVVDDLRGEVGRGTST